MMAALEDSITLIRDHYGEEVDLAHLPADDPTVYATLQKADTIGMFQVESRAQMSCLPRLRPTKFYDIVVQVAIIRPGPIVGQMVNPFLQRRQGREDVTYAHPSLEPVLKRTLGVPLFQEQLLRMAMVVADFSGGEAEDLRRAMGFKRSEKRMKEIEAKLRAGMERNGISREAQEQIVLSITSFALYGFPESHAASFALIAYASAYIKCHYLAAFTAALLNNQPMGFYRPATIVKDAQRHGLKIFPIDVMKSDWECTVVGRVAGRQSSVVSPVVGRWPLVVGQDNNSEGEEEDDDSVNSASPAAERRENKAHGVSRGSGVEHDQAPAGRKKLPSPDNGPNAHRPAGGTPALRIGLRYVRGLREDAGRAIVRQRNLTPFTSIHDLIQRVPELRKDELNTLAEIGALNCIGASPRGHGATENDQDDLSVAPRLRGGTLHRRDALWQIERSVRHSGPLLDELPEPDAKSPLRPMDPEERLVADFRGTGMTVGPHPMAYHRERLDTIGVRKAIDLARIPNGKHVRIGGCVIARQRPGTAKGFVFLSLEDETGVANAIIMPDLFQKNRLLVTSEQFLMVEGVLQNQDNVISVKAHRVMPLSITKAETSSHDFY
jgi:error-prone DNA polymerase